MLPGDSDVRPTGGNGIIRRALSRKMSSGAGGSTMTPPALTPMGRPRRRQSIFQQVKKGDNTGQSGVYTGHMGHHGTSLSTLNHLGVVCPPSPSPALFHRVVPAGPHRSSVFFRQRSHVRSQESIPDTSVAPINTPRRQRHSVDNSKQRRGSSGSKKGRKGRRSTDPSPRVSKNVVSDIDELMQQLGNIKRRLSTHLEDPAISKSSKRAEGKRLESSTLSSVTNVASNSTTPVKSPRHLPVFASVEESSSGELHSIQSYQSPLLSIASYLLL